MRWRRGGNTYIEDRRGQRLGPGAAIGGLGGIGAVIFLVLQLLSGGGFDPGSLDDFGSAQPDQRESLSDAPDPDADLVDFMGFVVEDVHATWTDVFEQAGQTYRPTDLVIFEEATRTGCGIGSAQTGPFYCPADSKMYLDLSFFRELRDRFGAPGDFAQAYVIAHEAGHHVQNLLGISDAVRSEQQSNPDNANDLSVSLELQADCFAGIWGNSAFNDQLLEEGDVQEGLDAAAAIGDDRLQRQAGQRVNRESWTHGSSAQRTEWFQRGLRSGRVDDCDTFT
jgi:predicted metalloprotease